MAKTNIKNINPDVIESWKRGGRLELNPPWQRGFIWPKTRQSELIESLLLGLPIGMLHVNVKENGSFVVFDGRQRLTSILAFITNELVLTGLEELDHLNGKKFIDLDLKLQNTISNYDIVLSEFTGEPKEFKKAAARINTKGINLNPAELVNMAYDGPLMDLLRSLKSDDEFKKLTSVSEHRFKDLGLVFDFFVFYFSVIKNDNYVGPYKKTIDDFFEKHMGADDQLLYKFKAMFKHFIVCSNLVFREGTAFRIPSGDGTKLSTVINKPVFRIVAPSFVDFKQLVISKNADAIRSFYFDMVYDPKVLEYLKNHTTMKENVDHVRNYWMSGLNKIINTSGHLDKTRLFSYSLKKQLFETDPVCKLCGNEILNIDLSEVDHIIPFSKGGKTKLDNAQLVHRSCNRSKGSEIKL